MILWKIKGSSTLTNAAWEYNFELVNNDQCGSECVNNYKSTSLKNMNLVSLVSLHSQLGITTFSYHPGQMG